MLPDPRPLREGRRRLRAEALGVTRLARVTGLDRTGVEVVAAVRPDGHVLQVTNGKGLTLAAAADGAIAEAAELWAAEQGPPALAPVASAEALRRERPGESVLAPSELAPDGDPAWDALALGWRAAVGLLGPRRAWVPAQAVSCPAPGARSEGLAVLRWTSNGLAAHPRRDAALRHALLEVVERDQLARALPLGFTEGALAARALDPSGLHATPATAALVRRVEASGLRVVLVDATPDPRDGAGALALGLPVAAALLVDAGGGPVPVAAGYACRLTRDGALSAALLEAAQSRATEIHGAREDVLHGDRHAAAPLRDAALAARPRRPLGALPEVRGGSDASAVRAVLGRLARAGLGRAAAVDLPSAADLAVVKVVVPGLLVSELL